MEMMEVKVYGSFKELIEDWDFGYWRTSKEGVFAEYVSIAEFLGQPDIAYFSFVADYPLTDKETVAYWCKHKGLYFVVLQPEDDIKGFWVVYEDGYCYGDAFLTKEEAEEYIKENYQDNGGW